jgi:hypothetical protein
LKKSGSPKGTTPCWARPSLPGPLPRRPRLGAKGSRPGRKRPTGPAGEQCWSGGPEVLLQAGLRPSGPDGFPHWEHSRGGLAAVSSDSCFDVLVFCWKINFQVPLCSSWEQWGTEGASWSLWACSGLGTRASPEGRLKSHREESRGPWPWPSQDDFHPTACPGRRLSEASGVSMGMPEWMGLLCPPPWTPASHAELCPGPGEGHSHCSSRAPPLILGIQNKGPLQVLPFNHLSNHSQPSLE